MRIVHLVMTAVLALGLSACADDAPQEAAVKEAATGRAYVVRQVEAVRWTPVAAEVSTVDEAQVTARIPGILTSLAVGEGDYVRRGELIGRIVDSQLGYQSGALGEQAAAAQAQASRAQAELERVRFLYDNDVYPLARLEAAQAAARAAQAQVRAAQAQQGALEAVARQGAVTAPSSGRVLRTDVPAGSPVAPGTVIATITSGPLVLRLDLPESLVGDVTTGSAVVVETGTGEELRGRIARIYPAVSGGQVRADAQVPGLDDALMGRRVTARVQSGSRQALLVPEEFVTTRFGIDYVVLRAEDGGTVQQPVQAAPSGENGRVEILSGLSQGDTILAAASAPGGAAE
ncbi:efflux RND transporter periplasmic adaptor subunit [Aurantiacibacter poecillastricola]|uniref:efflux RND transporter periplasmic adaptor subunit n=1 Tax=Aurantiacibacter poecillastricola TaxID=3064385 RepID=UPI00273E31B8|nr:efflux RND transporter periplasmic adaptor subunit [Aurantiacibacter sp. 219JJ12-13]MDP5261116.1 efflux RND transporter periplasmic adaptor subunit [Aurantiacibacter sp. 219JJ12-13]